MNAFVRNWKRFTPSVHPRKTVDYFLIFFHVREKLNCHFRKNASFQVNVTSAFHHFVKIRTNWQLVSKKNILQNFCKLSIIPLFPFCFPGFLSEAVTSERFQTFNVFIVSIINSNMVFFVVLLLSGKCLYHFRLMNRDVVLKSNINNGLKELKQI